MAEAKTLSAHEQAGLFSARQKKLALLVVSLGFIMDLLDSTIVNIAIPSIKANLGASYSAIQWVVAGYALAFSALLVTGGRMGDIFGYKKLFMTGVAGFTFASFLCGIAADPNILISARLLQGAFAALMVPQVMSTMQIMYKPEERGAINGLFGMLGGLAASLGPVVGGLLIKGNLFNLDWRPIFLINVPIGIFGFIMAAKYLPEGKSPHPLKLDVFGTVLITAAILLLVYPLIQGRELDWPTWSFIMMAASLPVFGLFAWWQIRKEKRDGSPLVLPSLFKKRSFNIGMLINLLFEGAMIGFFLTFGLFLQIGLGFSPIHAALTGLPVAIGIGFTMATMGEKVIPKLGRRAIFFGTLVMTCGLAVVSATFHRYGLGLHGWQMIPGLLFVGVGMGMVFASLYAAVLNGVDHAHAGSASGILNAVQQVGGAVGVAVIGVIFFGQLTHATVPSFNKVTPQLQKELTALNVPENTQARLIAGTEQCFIDRSSQKASDESTPKSCQQTSGQSVGEKQASAIVGKEAARANSINFDNAFKWAMVYAASLLITTFLLAFALPKKFRAEAYNEV